MSQFRFLGFIAAIVGMSTLIVSLTTGDLELLYTVFLLECFLVPAIYLVGSRISGASLDIVSPYVLLPVTVGVVFGSAPALLSAANMETSAYQVTWALTVGMTGYYIGAGIVSVRTAGRLPDMQSRRLQPYNVRPAVLYATYGIGVVAMLAYWVRAGGIPVFAADLENARLTALTGSGVPFYLSFLMMVSYWLMLAPRSPIASVTRWALFILTVALLASTGWRNTVFAFVVLTLLIQHYTRPIRTPIILGAGAAAVLGAVAVGLYRVQSSNLTHYTTFQLMESSDYLGATRVYLSTYFDAFARNLATVIEIVPYSMPYQHGKSFVWNFLALMPGSSLEPFDFKLKLAAGQGFAGGGLPPTLVGEFYVNFGTAGIFVGMMAVGLLASTFHSVARVTSNYTLLIIGLIGSYYLFVSVRGGIGNVTLTVAWLILATLIVSKLALRSVSPTTGAERMEAENDIHNAVASRL